MNASAKRPFSRDQRTTIVYGMLVFVLIVVILQLWLLTATMNAWLGGDDSVAALPVGTLSKKPCNVLDRESAFHPVERTSGAGASMTTMRSIKGLPLGWECA